jgi:uncharacterized membrane protein YedE/YeeE
MIRNVIGFGTGVLFGLGLAVSHMVDPGKVLGFLDFAGDWDPSLLIVMGVAVVVTFIAYRMAKGRSTPVFAELFQWPTKTAITDPRLLGGSAVFGAGWGLVGYCPGPGISSLAYFAPQTMVFVTSVVVGSGLAGFIPKARIPVVSGTP